LEHSLRYIVLFAVAVCAVCSVFVAVADVSLRDRQARNRALDIQGQVLALAGIPDVDELTDDEVEKLYTERIEPRIVTVATGEYVEGAETKDWDQQKVMKDPDTSRSAPGNAARVRRIPTESIIYQVKDEHGGLDAVILPIQGMGLWGVLFGYLAVASDGETIDGITFYEHKETPGLGAEVDNPRWKALWPGRKIYDAEGRVAIRVKKGIAGPVDTDPNQVDGLSGATITSRGVTNTLAFWLGDAGFSPYLTRLRAHGGSH